MIIALAIVFVVLGLFFVTPAGAAAGARYNRDHQSRFFGNNGNAKSVPGMMVTGVIFVAVGVYLLVTQS